MKEIELLGIKKPLTDNNELRARDVLSLYALSSRLMHSLTERQKNSSIKWLKVFVLEVARTEPGVTHAQLRRYYGTSCGALTGMLTENVNNGCLRATPDPTDRRRSFYCTTELGKKYLDEVYAKADAKLVSFNKELTGEQRALLIKALIDINEFVVTVDKKKYHTDTPYAAPEPDPFL